MSKKTVRVRSKSRKLKPQFSLRDSSCDPGLVKTFKALAVKPTACLVQELKVRRHRHNVFVSLPLSADFEVTKHLAGNVGFEWLFDA